MEDSHFSFGGTTGHSNAEAGLLHTINQVLQPMRLPGKEEDIVGGHQCRNPPP